MTASPAPDPTRPVLVLWRTFPPTADAHIDHAGWHSDIVYGAPTPRLALAEVMLRYHIEEQDLLEAACYDLPTLLDRDTDARVHGQRSDTDAIAARLLAEADQLRAWREAQPAALQPSQALRDLHAALGVLGDALIGALRPADPDPTPDEDAALTQSLRACQQLIKEHAADQARRT